MNGFRKALGLAVIGVGSLLAVSAAADVITAAAVDPAGKHLYWQFSTDKDFNAYKVVLTDLSTGAVQVFTVASPGYGLGTSGYRYNVLAPGDNYRVVFKVQWVPGGSFTPEWAPVYFTA